VQLGRARLSAGLSLDPPHRSFIGGRAPQGSRDPVGATRLVQDRSADPDAGIRPERGAAVHRVASCRVDQAEHARLDQVVHFDVRRHAREQVASDPLDEICVGEDEFIEIDQPGQVAQMSGVIAFVFIGPSPQCRIMPPLHHLLS
jgi:hypothetical protein